MNKRTSLDADHSSSSQSEIPAIGQIKREEHVIETADQIDDHAKELAFMNEPVTIQINETSDPNAEQAVQVGINGRMYIMARGRSVTVPRCVVDRLARAKRTDIKTSERLDSQGNRTMGVTRRSALAYPFSVIEDRNPEGIARLRRVLEEAA